jgi:hypothetical protein
MSEVLRPYLVDLHKLRKAYGSKDAGLVDSILNGQAAYIADYEKQAGFKAENVTRNRLKHLIDGEVHPSGFGYLYGYCLELVCRHIGSHNPCSLFEDVHSAFLEKVRDMNLEVGVKKKLVDKRKPSKIAITVEKTKISVTCENVSFSQFQMSVTLMTNQGGFFNPDADWAISGSFSGPDYFAVISNALASVGLEALIQKDGLINKLVIREAGQSNANRGYRLKGLDFEARRYPVPIPQYADYPYVSFLAREEFQAELDALTNKDFTTGEKIITEARKQYSKLIQKAMHSNCDIVLFI